MVWSLEPREFAIDLSNVTTPEQLLDALAQHFSIPSESWKMWLALWRWISQQECPYRIQFTGWREFAQRMPKYARRLRRLLLQYQRWHGESVLIVEYA